MVLLQNEYVKTKLEWNKISLVIASRGFIEGFYIIQYLFEWNVWN